MDLELGLQLSQAHLDRNSISRRILFPQCFADDPPCGQKPLNEARRRTMREANVTTDDAPIRLDELQPVTLGEVSAVTGSEGGSGQTAIRSSGATRTISA
jgi:hypothetical protein